MMRPFHVGLSVASSMPGKRRTSEPMATCALERGRARAEAVVHAAAERHVLRGAGAVEVELVGVVAPVAGVAVGRAEHGHHEVCRARSCARRPSTRLQRDAPGDLHRAVVAQQLLDRVGVERRVGRQRSSWSRLRSSARCRCR